MPRLPDTLRVGASVVFKWLPALAKDWGCSESALEDFLSEFGIPLVECPNGGWYVSLYPLETLLFQKGFPKGWQNDDPGLVRAHQELAGVLYGALTRDTIVKRVKALVRATRKE